MATIVTRASKGSALTFTEGDANIVNLNNDKIELTNLSASTSGDGSLTYNNTTGAFTYSGPGVTNYRAAFSAGTGISYNSSTGVITSTITQYTDALARASLSAGTGISYNSSTGVITSTVTPGIASVSADTTPALGGNLNVSTFSIISSSNGNITVSPNGTGRTVTNRLNYNEAVHSLGTTSGTVAPNATNGNVQTITLNGNLTLNAFTSPVAGQSITLIVNTGGTGRTLTSTMKWAGGEKTLSTTNTTDIISVFYDGTNYWASLSKDFK
jgi:hypothetical protein